MIAGVLVPIGAVAQAIDDGTTCAAVQAIIGIAQPDKVKVQAVNDYVLSTLSTLDGTYVARGDPGIIAPMSDEGRNNTIKMVILWCGEHPEDTLRQRTAQIYPGMKGRAEDMGIDPPTDR